MEFQRGERVNLNFDTGAVEKLESEDDYQTAQPAFPTFVGDILERESSAANPPPAPSLKTNVNGFPAHKKRAPRVSAFKQQRAAKEQAATASNPTPQDAPRARNAGNDLNNEKKSIDEENSKRLAAMSAAEIEQERQELMQSLSPALIQKLMARSNIDEGSNERDLYPVEPAAPPATDETDTKPKTTSTKKVSFAAPEPEAHAAVEQPQMSPRLIRLLCHSLYNPALLNTRPQPRRHRTSHILFVILVTLFRSFRVLGNLHRPSSILPRLFNAVLALS